MKLKRVGKLAASASLRVCGQNKKTGRQCLGCERDRRVERGEEQGGGEEGRGAFLRKSRKGRPRERAERERKVG